MEINIAMMKLHDEYKKGDPRLGCVDRAHILYHIMKKKDLNPERKLFSFQNDQGKKIILSHCVIVESGMIYDANLEGWQNPIEFSKYDEMKRGLHPNLNLVWVDWEESQSSKNYFVDWLWDYLASVDEELMNEVKPLIEAEYNAYLDRFPYLKRIKAQQHG